MKLNKLTLKKNVGQAIVEFAIVLPILLLLVYGVLETGRLLFIYSTIVTASRQAVRYGATTGDGSTAGVPRFRDCAGIRLAAQKVDFLNVFNDDDIFIFHDNGPTNPPSATGVGEVSYCDNPKVSDDSVPPYQPTNNSRLVVRVRGDFIPIVRLVPFAERSQANGKPIIATSARTILVSISIPVNAAALKVPTFTIAHAPEPSQVGANVPVSVTLSGTAGVPTGTVDFSAGGVVICSSVGLVNGVADCPMIFIADADIVVTYYPAATETNYGTATSNPTTHHVQTGDTIVSVIDTPVWSLPGATINVIVIVENANTPGIIIPAGTVTIVNADGYSCGPLTLSPTGQAGCPLRFDNLGNRSITATYTATDGKHKNNTGTGNHLVGADTPTPSQTPKPTATTQPPTVPFTPTFTPTAVPNCNVIRDNVGTLFVAGADQVMYLNIPNTTGAPITIASVRVGWNYAHGHRGVPNDLNLLSATLNGTVFWTGSEHLPTFQIPLPASPLIIPPGGTQIRFLFDYPYDRLLGESVYITFSTPGCTGYPIDVTVAQEE